PSSTLFPYTTLFRSRTDAAKGGSERRAAFTTQSRRVARSGGVPFSGAEILEYLFPAQRELSYPTRRVHPERIEGSSVLCLVSGLGFLPRAGAGSLRLRSPQSSR